MNGAFSWGVNKEGATNMRVVAIRKQRGEHCSLINCQRVGYAIFTEDSNQAGISFYRLCKTHCLETVNMRNWSDQAKIQWRELNKRSNEHEISISKESRTAR